MYLKYLILVNGPLILGTTLPQPCYSSELLIEPFAFRSRANRCVG
jgi:hypothetical protein